MVEQRPFKPLVKGSSPFALTFNLSGIDGFKPSSMAFHGTYWHNDFGHANSNGCINLASADAKWIYRWSTPQVTFGEQQIYATGTRVEITL